MADLNKIANNIEEIVEKQVESFLLKAMAGTLNSFDVKAVEILAKTLNICKNWQDKMPSSSPFQNTSTDELDSFFKNEEMDGESDYEDDDSGYSEAKDRDS